MFTGRFSPCLHFLLASLLLTAPSLAGVSYPPHIAEIVKKGTLVVAMPKEDSVPFFMTGKAGQVIGLDAVISQDIAEHLGVKLVIDRTSGSYEDSVMKVNEGKADLAVCHLTISLERALKVNFSEPYLLVKHVLLINRLAATHLSAADDEGIEPLLANAKIALGVKVGTYFSQSVKTDFPKADVHSYVSNKELYDAVEKGEVLGVLTDEVSVKGWQYDHPTFSIKVKTLTRSHRTGRIAIAVNWGAPDLLSWVNTYIETVKLDHRLDQWSSDYLEEKKWKGLLAK